jgi:hypothetical protein
MPGEIEIFIAYAQADAEGLDLVFKAVYSRVKPLTQKKLVSMWDDRQIVAGTVAALETQKHLQAARIILLLISADFMASEFCYSDEMENLMKRHQAGEVCIIPILLREAYWQEASFGELQPLPAHGDFIQSANNKDRTLLIVADGVRQVVDQLLAPLPSLTGRIVPEESKPMTSSTFTNGYALLIGVGADLPVTVQDATAVRDLLVNPARAGYPVDQVTLLTETTADRKKILAAFDHLIEQANSDPEATVIVYFSGHGGKFSSPDLPPEYCLVPYGFDRGRRADTALSDQEFTAKIEAIRAQKLVVLLDCCHAGGMPALKDADIAFEKSPLPPGLLNVLQAGSGRVVVASSRENEYSYTGKPYSVFTACLIEALGGKGSGTKDGLARILDVLAYLFAQVPPRTSDKQHPFVNKIFNLDDNFSLCYYAGGEKSVPGEASIPPLPAEPAGMTAGRRRRLEAKLQEQQALWTLRNEKVQALQQALAIDIEPLTRIKHEKELLQEKAALKQVEDELDRIERALE